MTDAHGRGSHGQEDHPERCRAPATEAVRRASHACTPPPARAPARAPIVCSRALAPACALVHTPDAHEASRTATPRLLRSHLAFRGCSLLLCARAPPSCGTAAADEPSANGWRVAWPGRAVRGPCGWARTTSEQPGTRVLIRRCASCSACSRRKSWADARWRRSCTPTLQCRSVRVSCASCLAWTRSILTPVTFTPRPTTRSSRRSSAHEAHQHLNIRCVRRKHTVAAILRKVL